MEHSPERTRLRPSAQASRFAPVLALLLGTGPVAGADAPRPS